MQLLYSFIILFTALNASAQSQKLNTLISSNNNIVESNFKELSEFKTEIGTFNALEECSSKNLIYFGKGAAGVDSKGCLNPAKLGSEKNFGGKNPKFAGFYDHAVSGDLGKTSHGTGSAFVGQILADSFCYSKYSGSRMMRYEDIPFIFKQLPRSSHQYIWIGSSLLSSGSGEPIAKGLLINTSNCAGWTSNSSTKNGLVLKINHTTDHKVKLDNITCNVPANIACIYN